MRFYKTCDGKCGRKHLPQTAAQTKMVEHIKTNYTNENGKYTICLTYMLNGKCKCDKNNPQYNYQRRHIYWKSIRQKMQGKWREQVVNKQVVECVQPAAPERDSFNMPMMDALRAEINELKRLILRLTAPSETKTSNEKMNTMSIQTELEMVVTATQTELVAPIDIETMVEIATQTESVVPIETETHILQQNTLVETSSQETQTETQIESIDEGTPPGPPDVSLPIRETLTIKNKIEPAAITNWDFTSILVTELTMLHMKLAMQTSLENMSERLLDVMSKAELSKLIDYIGIQNVITTIEDKWGAPPFNS